MNIHISHTAPPASAEEIPDFPLVRFDTGMAVYEEALVDGQYLGATWSAMGRPQSRERIWHELRGGAFATRPVRRRQHAFQLQVDGQNLTDRWQWDDGQDVTTADSDCRECVVTLRHALRPVTVKVHTRLDDTAFLVRWLEITNTGDKPAAIAQVSPWSGMVWAIGGPPQRTVRPYFPERFSHMPLQVTEPFMLGRFRSTTALVEGEFDWEPLPDGALRMESLHGRSGWGMPFFVVKNQVTQEVLVGHFAWSGNWQIEFFNDHEPTRPDAHLYLQAGLAGPPPLRVLSPGESASTAAVHLGYLYGDLDPCVQALHEHLRRSVMPKQPEGLEHPVECNHTGYTLNAQITQQQLFEEVDTAADVGCELFVVDAGWFGDATHHWEELVGDWEESPLLPQGLKPVFDRARKRDMRCGLWVEAERAGSASRVVEAHPDWQMRRRGETILHLDLAKPEVAQHVEDTIVRLVERFELDCFRLDYNIRCGEGGEAERDGLVESTAWRYYDALHGIFDRVRQRFPSLILENCASGGGRMDLGMMSRFHWTQISDNWSPGPTLKIVNGMTMALPPEQCMTLLGAISPAVSDLDFMLRIGLFNHFTVSGIFPTMAERHEVARERWRHTIRLFKDFARPILSTCRVFHHTPIQRQTEPGEWCVLEYAAADASRAYAGVFRLPGAQGDTFDFVPKGLSASRRYEVTFDNTGQSREMEGGDLLDTGLRVRVPGGFQSELLLLEAI